MIRVIKGPEAIITRPELYIGKRSIYGLMCFVTGCQVTDPSGLAGYNAFFQMAFPDFETSIKNKIKKKYKHRSFESALAMCGDDDEKAFHLWIEWFKEFKGITSEKLEGTVPQI